jgi:hypothetical protein
MEQIAVLDGLGDYDVNPVPGGGQNYTGGSDWFPGAPYRLQQEGLAGGSTMEMEIVTPVPGEGQNYSGGSSWSPGFPYRLQQDGLAGGSTMEMEVVTPVPGGGQNYSGGSNWFPGAPYRLQQDGLAGAALRGALTSLRETTPGAPQAQTMARARGMAKQALAALPAWARGSVGAVAYFSALYTAMQLGQSMEQARSTARAVLDTVG